MVDARAVEGADVEPAGDPVAAAAVALRAHVEDLTTLSAAERRLFAEWLDRAATG